MSAFTKPFLITAGDSSVLLERIPFTNGADKQDQERRLQKALYENPESLPVQEIDPHIGPLIPVCREIETGSGPADILYVTPTGQVVLVETKLWRNSEARREVVAQILDYAKNLTTWTYDILDAKAALAAGDGKGYLLECLRRHDPDANTGAFVDGINRSLATGDILLLIIGDGIRSGAESLITFLERYWNLNFSFGLVEVAAYRLPSGDTLVQPRILAKTEILRRTILLGPSGPVRFEEVAQDEETRSSGDSQREWYAAFWREFLAKLRLDDQALLPTEPAKSTNQFFSMPPSGSVAWLSAYIARSLNVGGVYLTFSKTYPRGLDIFETLLSDRETIEREVGAPLSWGRDGDKIHISVPNVKLNDLSTPADRERVTTYLADMTQRMIRVLKPRLEAATREVR